MSKHGLEASQLALLQSILSPFASQIDKVGLFGSRATGKFRPNSDVDMVIYGPLDYKTEAHIFTLLNESSLPVNVDVHVYEQISYQPLKEHIDSVMLPLFTHEQLLAPSASSLPSKSLLYSKPV